MGPGFASNGYMIFTKDMAEARFADLDQQEKVTRDELQRLNLTLAAISGAKQDLAFWEGKRKAEEEQEAADREAARKEREEQANRLDMALAHQEGLNDGAARRNRKTRAR